jgi:hypothetical protein
LAADGSIKKASIPNSNNPPKAANGGNISKLSKFAIAEIS